MAGRVVENLTAVQFHHVFSYHTFYRNFFVTFLNEIENFVPPLIPLYNDYIGIKYAGNSFFVCFSVSSQFCFDRFFDLDFSRKKSSQMACLCDFVAMNLAGGRIKPLGILPDSYSFHS